MKQNKLSAKARNDAFRLQRRNHSKVHSMVSRHTTSVVAPKPRPASIAVDELTISFIGGQDGIGEKNMQVIEWQNDAIILDCGNDLSIDLPGINYAVNDPAYLETIKHKIRGYVVSHGHLDHLGGLRHIVPKFPAPIYGSPFTLGVIEKSFEDEMAGGTSFKPQLISMHMDSHERAQLGVFTIELVRVTHAVPESSAIVVDTPVGRIINSGDFRLDPEPLDHMPTDIPRLRQLGNEGVLLLMSESTYTNVPGRQLTEHTLRQSFQELVSQAEGRVFVSIFSSNINRIQMIIDAAVADGRRVALDGRSMMTYAEIAVRQGILKIPADTVLPLREMPNVPDKKVLVMCTGGQGEPGSVLQRMASGEHKHIALRPGDTVIVSSNPIPGNEVRYQEIGDELARRGVRIFRNPSHEVDGCGPLHVGGHARRDEHRELLNIVRPKFFAPIYGGALNRKYHRDIAVEEGLKAGKIIMANNGERIAFKADSWRRASPVPSGSLLIDQTGAVVNQVVVKDRLMLSQEGIVTVMLAIDQKTGRLITSPDIVSRGFIALYENEALLKGLRADLRALTAQRFPRITLDDFKAEVKDHLTQAMYATTGRCPIVIPVVNLISTRKS